MKIELGKIDSLRLDNGIGIFVCQDKRAPIASFQAWVATGSVNEAELIGSGISHFLEHMVFKGTKNFTKKDITSKMDQLAARFNAYTSYHNTVFYADAPATNIIKAADIIIDLVRNPLFPQEEFKLEKDVIIRERAMRSDIPDILLSEKLLRTMFSVNPLRHPVIGYQNRILAVTRDDIVGYHKKRYRPENIFFVACGDVNPDEVFTFAKKKCDDWENLCHYDSPIPNENAQQSLREENFSFNDPLSRLAIAFHTPPISDPLSPVFDVLGIILGANESSRLISKIEREKKLSVSIGCSHHAMPYGGLFCASGSAEPEKLEAMKDAIMDEFSKITNAEPPSKNEIERVVRQISSDFTKSLRSIDAIAALIGKSIMSYGDPSYALRYLDQLHEITPEKTTEAASKFIKTENCSIVRMVSTQYQKKSLANIKRKKSPVTEKIRAHKINGIPKMLVCHDNTLPLFDIVIVSKGGTILESSSSAGINDLLTSCLPCGSAKYNEKDIAEILDDNAIDLSVASGNNVLHVSLTAGIDNFDASLDILGEIIATPSLPEDAITREMNILLRSLASEKLSPRRAASEKTRKILYGTHPYALDSEDKMKALPQMTKKLLSKFYLSKCLSIEDSVIAVSGALDDKHIERLSEFMKSLPWRNDKIIIPKAPKPLNKKTYFSAELPREQTIVTLSFPACDFRSPERYHLNIASAAMNGMNSSLFQKIREDNGMAYYTGMSSFMGIGCGHIMFYAGISLEHMKKTIDILRAECSRLISEGALTKTDFESAKEKILFQISESTLNPRDRIMSASCEELLGNGFEDHENAAEIYGALSLDDINSTMTKYLSTENYLELSITPEIVA